MITNVRLYAFLILAIAIVLTGAYVKKLYNDYQAMKLDRDRIHQNELALGDSINQMAARLTKTTAFVRDLNLEIQKKDREYIALQANFFALIDSVHASASSTPALSDSDITVPFSGEKSISVFSGKTNYNFISKQATWSINIAFRPVEVRTLLVEEENVWKFKVLSLTPGVLVKGTGVLDNDTYRRLQKYSPPETPKRFMLGGVMGQHGGLGIGYRTNDWTVLGFYSFINAYDDNVVKNINIGIFWSPF